jgi:hypothetical protein
MRLLVGLTTVTGSIQRYAERFDAVELRADSKRLPPPRTLRKLRAQAPALVTSFLVSPKQTLSLFDDPALVEPLLRSADAFGASWLMLQTGPDLGPSRRTRTRLEALVTQLRGETRRIAWEPHGLWEDEVAREAAAALGVTLVQDLSATEGTHESVIYTRLRTMGPGAQLKVNALEALADELSGAEEAIVIVEGKPSLRARSRIRQIVQNAALEDDEEDGEASTKPQNGLNRRPLAAASAAGESAEEELEDAGEDDDDLDDEDGDLDEDEDDDDLDEDEDDDDLDEDEDEDEDHS